ncbi:hypothetical protein BO78DRAFT_220267 [Aspergillus sclerotiicarbonarius CBS 121057]|uniref:Uncharacterized protein n=1 Tax=Aspergillus sclerotiicarbonarius (strain CBS 121057 / IBT 28362) TaxID=1448318 RepID=A0A319FM86_ASPSB|nr:hypothetical protein BO78DRAFT_220267 [Aspergillus sclerotiicarbonarius CBS 121057]
MVPITERERPKTDYERWLEAQNEGAPAGSDQAQYHPPSHDAEEADTSSTDSGSGHKYSHGMFLHHTYHHQSAAGHGHGVGVGVGGPHGVLPGVLPGFYGMVAMKVAVLALLVAIFLRVGRFVRGRRYQQIQLQGQGPRTPQVGDLGVDVEKRYLV